MKKLEDWIECYWPQLREIYISPLTRGDDKIVTWQVEVNWCGHTDQSFFGDTLEQAMTQAQLWMIKQRSNNATPKTDR